MRRISEREIVAIIEVIGYDTFRINRCCGKEHLVLLGSSGKRYGVGRDITRLEKIIRCVSGTRCICLLYTSIHHRHSLLAIARTAIPEVDAIEPVSRNEDCDLAHEIGNLRIGHVAEPDAAATAFDADAHLAAFVLHLSDVFVGMLYRITQIGSRSEEGAFRIGSIAHLSLSLIHIWVNSFDR